MSKTIEVFSIHGGPIHTKVKGEPRTVEFEPKGGVFAAMCDHDEAAVLLSIPGDDFWKDKIDLDGGKQTAVPAGDKDQDQPPLEDGATTITLEAYGQMKNTNALKAAVAKCNDKDAIAKLVATEASAIEPREKWLAILNDRLAAL
jgi:transcriptional regulator of nitric oxide reductase